MDQVDPEEGQVDREARGAGLLDQGRVWVEPLWYVGTAGCADACVEE